MKEGVDLLVTFNCSKIYIKLATLIIFKHAVLLH